MANSPWHMQEGVSRSGKDGWYVADAGGGALWNDGEEGDGGVCSEPVARLIAAAPALVEALERIIRAHDEGFREEGLGIDEARSVLASLRGEETP